MKPTLAKLMVATTALLPVADLPASISIDLKPAVIVDTKTEPPAAGRFEPTWQSLAQYQPPEWFRDAKFGIWAHWGPQCQPEHGDWYARAMYMENAPSWASHDYEFHRKTYGPQSKFGFKDVINTWKAEKWNPNSLMALYKRAG